MKGKNAKKNNRDGLKLVYSIKEEDFIDKIPLVEFKKVRGFGQLRFDNWNNLLFLGDNLAVLRGLLEDPKVAGKVKLVYIDPPFSTNQIFKSGTSRTSTISSSREDKSAYEDLLIGPEYLEFLRKRLILLREIMSEDGSMYVHIDWKMGHYVKVLMDEVFGQEHFINDITRIKCNPKNFERKGYGNIKDMVLFYSKTDNYIWHGSREEMSEDEIRTLFPKIDKDGRRYTTTPLHAPGETLNGPTGQPWKGLKPLKGRHWRCSPEELTRLDNQGLIEWSSTGNPRKKIYADDVLEKGKWRQDIWKYKDPPYPTYPTEKNLEMIKMIIETSSNPSDIVLDCFAGSGSTLIAAEETGRRWIGIDNSKTAIEVSKKKLNSIKNHLPFSLYQIKEENRKRKESPSTCL